MAKQQLKLLIVDDSSEERENYRSFLSQDSDYTYNIWEESSGEKGLELCRQIEPDGVLLDLQLADFDALEFITRLKSQNFKKTPLVIVLAQEGNGLQVAKAMKSGACDYLIKEETTPECLRCAVHHAMMNAGLHNSLQQSEQRFNLALEAAQMGIWEWNILTDEVWLSPNFTSLFGVEGGTFADTLSAWLTKVHPDDREAVKNAIVQNRHSRNNYFQEYRLLLNGRVRWVYSQGKYLYDEAGEQVQMVGTIQDISERKQAEERLIESQGLIQKITETTPGLIYVYDLIEQRNIYLNPQALELIGYTSEALIALEKEAIPQIMHPEDRLRLAAHWQKFNFATDSEVFNIEYRMRHANGQWRWFRSRDKVFKRTALGLPHQIIGSAQDITERKYAEQSLQRSHEQFQLATMAVNCLVYNIDVLRSTVERTGNLIELLGYSQEEVLPTPEWWLSLIHPHDQQRVNDQFQAHLAENKGNSRFTVEYRLRYKDKERYLWVQDMGFVVCDADSKPVKLAGITIDITERKEVEKKLQESIEQVQLATTAAEVGMWFWDIPKDELVWTEKCKQLFGLPPDTKITYQLFLNSLHPDDRQRTDAAVTLCLEENVEYNIEYRTVWADGNVRWIAAKGRSFHNTTGNPVKMMGTAQDITERKQIEEKLARSQERLELAQEAGNIGIFDWDILTGRISWNEQEESIFGLPPGTFGGTVDNWRAQVHADDLQIVEQSFKKTFANQAKDWQGEFRIFRADNKEARWLDAKGCFFYDESGKPVRMIGVNIDITDRKYLELERQRLLELEKAANKAKDNFVAMVSHDLRAPLNSILGWTKLLRSGKLDPQKTAKALETIERSAKSQSRLIEDLLDVSRMIEGKIHLALAPTKLDTLIQSVVDQMHFAANEKQINLVTKIDTSVELISADSNRLQQIITNLVSNAIKFTPQKGRVEIYLKSIGSQVQIQVIDTGKGISSEFLPYVFERFRQEEIITVKSNEGLGLGLAIVRYLVELHGGTVTAESQGEGRGATFTVRLPIINPTP